MFSLNPTKYPQYNFSSIKTAIFAACLFCGSSTSAQSTIPTVNGDILTMPVVAVLDLAFRIDFQIVIGSEFVDLVLVDFEQLEGVDTSGAPSFFDNVINMPALDIDGDSFWGEFLLVSDDPITFRMTAANVNDAGESGTEGRWRITEVVDASDCGEGEVTDIYNIDVLIVGDQLSVRSPYETFDALLIDNVLEWSGSYPFDDGTETILFNITFSENRDSLTGTSEWSWTDGTEGCEGTSNISGVLLHN